MLESYSVADGLGKSYRVDDILRPVVSIQKDKINCSFYK